MTAIAVVRPFGRRGVVLAPTPATESLRRLVGTLHEPNAWTAGILLATGIAVIARHPIAHALGTEVDTPAVSTPAVAVAPHPSVIVVPAAAAPVVAVPTHAPRNPFASLVSTTGAALAPAAAPAVARAAAPPAARITPSTIPAAGSCSGHVHHVATGDSLWTLAARAVHSSDIGRVTIAWHRLYAANRGVIGSDPSLLLVGTNVCVPSAL